MRIFFSVGEPSGDLHGANLIQQLRASEASIECVGFGGPRMQQAGLEPLADLTKMAVLFFWQVLTKIPAFYKLYRSADRYFASNKVDAVVLIDYPGFNWWIAKAAKRHGITVFYYGVPQMWAWAPWRVRKLRKRVDHIICKLPFEKKWFEKRNCQAHFVGHPYFDELKNQQVDQQFMRDFGDDETKLLTLLPGSREQEVEANLGWMLETAAKVHSETEGLSVVVACFNEAHSQTVLDEIRKQELPFDVMFGRTPELIRMADVCLACSGSVSLELMYHRKPSVIVYRLSPAQWVMKKLFLRIPYVTLVNLLWLGDLDQRREDIPRPTSRRIPFPEFTWVDSPAEEMSKHLCRWLKRDDAYQTSVGLINEVAIQVETNGASKKAAESILSVLGRDGLPENVDFPTSQPAASDWKRAA